MSQINDLLKSKRLMQMKRVFSTESTTSSCQYPSYVKQDDLNQLPYKYNRLELVFKLLELATDIINAGLYSGCIKQNITLIEDSANKTEHVGIVTSVSNMIFPNVVFSSFIIIVGVILISYLLGQIISEVIGRIFNTLALILHFIAACITLNEWIVTIKTPENASICNLLFAQVFTTFLSTFLYSFDLFLSLKRALKYDPVES